MRRFRTQFDIGEVHGIEFGDVDTPINAVWLHATGFNAMTYQTILAPIGVRTRIVGLDMRGHGRTTLPATPKTLKGWNVFRDDVIAWLDHVAPDGVVLGGHSMGGCVALLVAAKRPDLVNGLCLVDPVIMSRRVYRNMHTMPFARMMTGGSKMARGAKRRRAEFPSPEAALESYTNKSVFKSWREPFLSDYVMDGLTRVDSNLPDGDDQTWRLSCEPNWEAAVFKGQRHRPWQALAKVTQAEIPVTIIRPENHSVISDKTMRTVQKKYPTVNFKTQIGTSHFLPMETPYVVRDTLEDYLSYYVEDYGPAREGLTKRMLSEGRRDT